jgi:hypothetical protein
MTSVEGLRFEDCWARRESAIFGGVSIALLHVDDLIVNKRAVGRPQDLLDLEKLEEFKRTREQ